MGLWSVQMEHVQPVGKGASFGVGVDACLEGPEEKEEEDEEVGIVFGRFGARSGTSRLKGLVGWRFGRALDEEAAEEGPPFSNFTTPRFLPVLPEGLSCVGGTYESPNSFFSSSWPSSHKACAMARSLASSSSAWV